MSLLTIRDAIAAAIKPSLIGIKTCEGHAGRFDLNEIKRIATKAPALYLSISQIENINDDGNEINATIHWVAFIITRDIPGTERDVSALAYVQALISLLPGNNWALDETETTPKKINAKNLYTANIDKKGIAMWAVSWSQRMMIGTELDLTILNNFVTYHAEHSLVEGPDEPAAIDNQNIPQ